ncbi:bacillithiol biosynthesis deacetylase BshB2 [Oceanobacillus alkalisoli]|uniref:bacillithiol biosynthesis deacetylase BshB2 n=1 Tax=Oceanobacillus alkalisoli TaxID=2925113 RepID=UPI001EF04DF6|nr:bacillithiol biosynthesis deacetylase BshB2 [Oceanobacillus alkalisoli]MCF3942146.1 bacillithiol biosynthesis deacetylase BshB2 [Oceanobacillus alkalisoli]MCG5104380.1 bacillithiol biosynthesis deacetylase BshB2 [Oceanobacillus alkalisoli]
MEKHVVVIYPHPDDESFGAAGTIIQYRKQGVPVTYLCGTLGEMGRNMGNPPIANRESLSEIRKEELLEAARVLDMEVEMLGFRDKTLEFEDRTKVATNLKEYLDRIKPSLVITHYPDHAVHPDHHALGAAAIEAVRMMDKSERPVVWAQAISRNYTEVLGKPDVINDVRAEIDTKLDAIYAHKTQAAGVLSQFMQPGFSQEEFKKKVANNFSTEQFYIWKYND